MSYHRALRSAMREAPDVILIGEIRDRETMQAAIDLAGTGHLAIATLHANNSPETLDRIINMYPNDQHKQVLMDLSQYVRVIISQRLVRSKEGKRVAAVEVMLNTPHISELILKGDISNVKEAFKDTKEPGMQSFDQALFDLYRQRRDQHGRGALERRLAREPRSQDQLRLVTGRFGRCRCGGHLRAALPRNGGRHDLCASVLTSLVCRLSFLACLRVGPAGSARDIPSEPARGVERARRRMAGKTWRASKTGPSTQTRFMAGPSGVCSKHRAAGAAADAARHVLLERDLARQVEVARELRDGLQHRRRAAREHLRLAHARSPSSRAARRGRDP